MFSFPKLQTFFEELERKNFYTYLAIAGGVFFALVCAILYHYYSTLSSLQGSLRTLNKRRDEAQFLLQKRKLVKKQEEEVNATLAEEKKFRIQDFFNGIVEQNNLKDKQRNDPIISEESLHNYTEIKLVAQFRQLSTQELCELLNSLEQKQRIYTKELIISKMKGASLDVSLSIATLQLPNEESKQR